ncbi:MAG: hypothetical protein Q8R20_02140 [Nanoarchaeota archaeon]|nr:hypothetical protein [Nanoarchaeota archaeon]
MQFFQIIWETIKSAPWVTLYFIVKYVIIGLTIVIGAAFLVLLPYAWNYGKIPFRWKNQPKKYQRELKDTNAFQRQWEAIIAKSDSSPPDSFITAIMETDAMIDEILKEMGLPGEHMPDRLESLNPETTKSMEHLWRAHSMKNNLMHTPGFTLTEHEAKRVLGDYEAFLKEIGIV